MDHIHLKLLIRNMFKRKSGMPLILGNMVIGMLSFIFITIYVKGEFSYDKHNENADNIYRVIHNIDYGDSKENSASCPFPISNHLINEYPDLIRNAVRLFNWWGETYTIKTDDLSFNENKFVFTEPSMFDIFTFSFLAGNPVSCLNGPYKIVMTKSQALKYFGSVQHAMNKKLRVNDQYNVEITAVIEDLRKTSHFDFNMFCSLSTFKSQNGNNIDWWWCNPAWTYILLNENVNPVSLSQQFSSFKKKYVPNNQQQTVSFELQALNSIHLKSNLDSEIKKNGSLVSTYILITIAFIILSISLANYILSSIINGHTRTKEIIIRKILGSNKSHMLRQSVLETGIILLLTSIISLITAFLIIPYFNQLSNSPVIYMELLRPDYIAIFLIMISISGLVMTVIPHVYFSGLRFLAKNHDTFTNSLTRVGVHKKLIIFQFVLSVSLILGSIIIINQLQFMHTHDPGFNKNNLLVLNIKNTPLKKNFYSFKNELDRNPGVINSTFMECIPGREFYTENFYPEGLPVEDQKQLYNFSRVHKDYVKTLGLEIVAGRDFSDDFSAEPEEAILINETMVQRLGWTNTNAIGKKFHFHNEEKVIGVIKDFNFHSLHTDISPLAIDLVRPNTGQHDWATNYVVIRVRPENISQVLPVIEKIWGKYATGVPFDYFYLDSNFKKVYYQEGQLMKTAIMFTFIAIILSGIGLFNLVRLITSKRIKEIGIRKVNGAKITEILTLINKDFLLSVGTAFIIACPLTLIFINQWLQNFAYRTEIHWWLFALSGLIVFGIAFMTVTWQSWKAARKNPVEALRYE